VQDPSGSIVHEDWAPSTIDSSHTHNVGAVRYTNNAGEVLRPNLQFNVFFVSLLCSKTYSFRRSHLLRTISYLWRSGCYWPSETRYLLPSVGPRLLPRLILGFSSSGVTPRIFSLTSTGRAVYSSWEAARLFVICLILIFAKWIIGVLTSLCCNA